MEIFNKVGTFVLIFMIICGFAGLMWLGLLWFTITLKLSSVLGNIFIVACIAGLTYMISKAIWKKG